MNKANIGIIGATSYTGRELIRLLLKHPYAQILWLSSESFSGKDYSTIYPEFTGKLPVSTLNKLEQLKSQVPDVVFSCLPHGASAKLLSDFIISGKCRVIDLSADYRLHDMAAYQGAYGLKHPFPQYAKESVFGLSELYAQQIASAQIVGNPGCYPTSILLPLMPLLKAGIISELGIIADSKSGVSGAGRSPSATTHYANCNESINAYKLGDQHRHLSEIQEQLNVSSKRAVSILFTPHLVPMERGILSTIYCTFQGGKGIDAADSCLKGQYQNCPFVHIVPHSPKTGDVRHTNNCHIHLYQPANTNTLIILSVIDNMVKGASGQAVQNMNLMFGFPEDTSLC